MTRAPKALLPFKKAKRYVQTLELAKRDAWRAWVKQNRATLSDCSIPSRPDAAYKHQGWRSWSDWLGSNLFQPKQFISYAAWRQWLAGQPFRTKEDYNDWCSAGGGTQREWLRIPSSPAQVYRQFRGWPLELPHASPGTRRGGRPLQYAPFGTARQYVRHLVKSAEWDTRRYKRTEAGWRAYARDHKTRLREQNIPAAPDRIAQYQENWRGWRDFLGANTRPTPNRKR